MGLNRAVRHLPPNAPLPDVAHRSLQRYPLPPPARGNPRSRSTVSRVSVYYLPPTTTRACLRPRSVTASQLTQPTAGPPIPDPQNRSWPPQVQRVRQGGGGALVPTSGWMSEYGNLDSDIKKLLGQVSEEERRAAAEGGGGRRAPCSDLPA